jgi:hypothetical protein
MLNIISIYLFNKKDVRTSFEYEEFCFVAYDAVSPEMTALWVLVGNGFYLSLFPLSSKRLQLAV